MVNPNVGYFEDDQAAIDRMIEVEIDAAEEADRDAELAEINAAISAEEAENDVPYCCEECLGQEMAYATQRSVR